MCKIYACAYVFGVALLAPNANTLQHVVEGTQREEKDREREREMLREPPL